MNGVLKILIAALFVVSPVTLPKLALAYDQENTDQATSDDGADQSASDQDSDEDKDKDKKKKKKKKKKDRPKCVPTGSRLNRC